MATAKEIKIDPLTGFPVMPDDDERKRSVQDACNAAAEARIDLIIRQNPELEAYIDKRVAEGIAAAQPPPEPGTVSAKSQPSKHGGKR